MVPILTLSKNPVIILISFLILAMYIFRIDTASPPLVQKKGNCFLPEKWRGSWSRGDLDDAANPLVIRSETISVENEFRFHCVKSLEDSYVFEETDAGHEAPCFRCVFFVEKHSNVLFYRQSECNREPTTEDCFEIDFSRPLAPLFRIDASRVACPFGDKPMSFDYSTDGRLCPHKESGSRVETCADMSILAFNYEACVDVPGTQQLKEELICLGSWQENSYTYFIGRVIEVTQNHKHTGEGFRCFNYAPLRKKKTAALDVTGYVASRSSQTGSCSHAESPTSGAWTYNFSVVAEERYAPLPNWLESYDGIWWKAMNLTFFFEIDAIGGKMETVPIRTPSQENTTQFQSYQFTSYKIENLTQNFVSLQANEYVGCKRIPICMDVYRRSENIVEMELHHRMIEAGQTYSCQHQAKVNRHLTYTLVREDSSPVTCPLLGVYKLDVPSSSTHHGHVTQCQEIQNNERSLSYLEIGCSGMNSSGLEFFSSCDPSEETPEIGQLVSSLQCIGFWTEDQTTYVVANNSNLGIPGYRCFQFVETQRGKFSVFVSFDDCKPSSDWRLITWTFNMTLQSGCDEFVNKRHTNTEDLSSLGTHSLQSVEPWCLFYSVRIMLSTLLLKIL